LKNPKAKKVKKITTASYFTCFYSEGIILKAWQFNGSVMLPFLNMVPYELFFYP